MINLNSENFQKEVIENEKTVLVDFFAPWCGPCKMMGPVLEEFEKEYEGEVSVFKVNVDDEGDLAQKYGIMSIPTVIVFKNGEVYKTSVGLVTKQKLADMVK